MRALLAALLVAAAALPAAARPLPPIEDPRLLKDLHEVRTSIAARELDRALALDREQARKVLPVVRDLVRRRDEGARRREVAARELLAVLRKVDAELAKGAVSEGSRKELAAARAALKPSDEEKAARKKLKAELAALFTPAQQETLRGFRPSVLGGPGAGERGERRGPPPAMGEGRHGRKLERVEGKGGKGGKGGAKRAAHLLASDAFVKLLEARAR